MDKLFDHTLRRQLALQTEKVESLQTQMTTQMKQMGELVDLLTKQNTVVAQSSSASTSVTNNDVVQRAQAINNGVIQNNIVAIVPWDSERRINISTAQIAAAFAENAMLQEYMKMSAQDMTDPEKAPPYVTELFVDLVKRGHKDPSARNVYLNPRRADQALVHMKTGQWEVVPAAAATRLLMDGVAWTIHQVVLTDVERQLLPSDAQNALSLAGMVYEDEPEEYVKRARVPMAAHLTNVAPAKLITCR